MHPLIPETIETNPRVRNSDLDEVPECLSDERVEQLLAGQLAGATQESAERHLEHCAVCNQRLLELAGPIPSDRKLLSSGVQPPNARTLRVLDVIAGLPPFPDSLLLHTGKSGAPETPDPLAGFVDLSFVGRGGAGTVYRARQVTLQRWVAVKVLSAEATCRSAARAQREAQALASLNHPHVVTVHEAQLLNSPPFLVMEWVSGGSLQERLQTGPLSIAEATALARQLAEAVVAVHALGLVHRDLKPANVLLAGPSDRENAEASADAPLFAKITDFGLVQTDQSGHRTTLEGLAVGTPAYMAPEQTGLRLGLGKVGPACDIYGVGAVIFAALTGRPPHEGETPMATLAHVAWEEVTWLRRVRPEVPVDLATIVAKCLRPLPGERYRSARELSDDLERFVRGDPILARSYTPREQLRNWMRRHPTLAVAMGLGGTLLMALALGVPYHLTQVQQSLVELRKEERRVLMALAEAKQATEAEGHLRRETARLTANAHQVMLESLRHRQALTHDDSRLLGTIRNFYHQQLQSSQGLGTELAEILGEGLTYLCFLESRDFKTPALAEEDAFLLLRLSSEYPKSLPLLLNRAHVLHLRWQALRREDRHTEAAQTLGEIIQLAERVQTSGSQDAQEKILPSVLSILWNAEDWHNSVSLLDRMIGQEQARLAARTQANQSWDTLLALQSQRVGLLYRLGRWSLSDTALEEWLEISNQIQSQSPESGARLDVHRLHMLSEHLQYAARHLSGDRRRTMLDLGRDLFAKQRWLTVLPNQRIVACVVWTLALESLPAEEVSGEELESTWDAIEEVVGSDALAATPRSSRPTLVVFQLRRASRALGRERFAEALQLARDVLAALDESAHIVSSQRARLLEDTLDVAARASRGLGETAEELAYLSRAADVATGEERTEFRRRMEQAAREQGIPLAEWAREAPGTGE